MTKIDYLTEDSIIDKTQKYVCISFLSDSTNKSKLSGIKIRGVFEHYDDACTHAKKLQNIDPYFNVFVGDIGKWLPFDPDPDSNTKHAEYANEELNNIMKSYLENQEKAKLFHEQRKSELMRQNLIDNMKSKNSLIDNIKEKIQEIDNEEGKKALEHDISNMEEHIHKLDKQIEELDESLKKINEEIKMYTENSVSKAFDVPKTIIHD